MTEDSDGTQDTDGIQQERTQQPETQQDAGGFGRASSFRVLLIEDNPGDARLFEELLEESTVRATLRHEETLEGGLSALRKERADVLVIDLGLPDSEGIETVRTAASVAPSVPIVVLTGQDNLEVALRTQKAGAAEYLQKGELTPGLLGRTLRWAVERTRMRDKLRQRDAWIRSITEGVSVGVFRVGPTGRIQYANEALARMLGFGGQRELVGEDLTAFYTDPGQQGRMLAEEGAEGAEVTFERQGGSELVGLLSAEAAYRKSGEVLHYDGTLTEITRRKKREAKLRVLSEAVGQAREAVVITEAGSLEESGEEIVYVNGAFEEMTGYAEEEILGETPRILQGPETDRETLDSLREALEAEEEWEGETVNYRKDGDPYRVQWSIAPVRGEEGAIEYWVSVQRDVTEERKREKRLTQLAQALDQVGDKVFITDRQGQIQFVNEAFEEITGYSAEEVVGQTPAVFQSGEHDEAFYEDLWSTIRSGESFRGEFINEKKDGTRYLEDEHISPVTNEEGEITHFVSSGRDITERKEREARLRGLANSIPGVLYQLEVREDGTYGFSFVSDRAEEIMGLRADPEGFLERAVKRTPDSHKDSLLQSVEEAIENTSEWSFEAPFDKPSGERVWIRGMSVPDVQEERTVFNGVFLDVTNRKETEQALRESEELHRATLSNITDAVLLTRADGTFSYVCPNVSHIFGYDEEEVQALGSISALLGSDPAEDRDLGEAQEISNIEHSVVDASGNRHDLLVNIRSVAIQDGRRMYTCRDITERKKEEARRKQVIERVTDAIVEVDDQWRFTLVNEQAEALYDMEEEELLGKDFWEVFAEAWGTRLEDEYRSVMQTRERTRFEEYYSGLDGWFDIQVYPNDDGGVAFYFEEITERKEQEQELRDTKRLLEKTLESLSEAILVVDPPSREIVDCNSAVEEIFGYEPQELIGRSTEVLHVDEELYEWFGALSEPELDEEGRFATEYRMQRKNGTIIDTENVVTPLKGDEWPGGVVSAIRDITDRKNRERELAEQRALLEAQSEATIDGLLAVGQDRNVAFYNDRFLEVWDIPEGAVEEDPVGNPLDDVLLNYVTDKLDDPERFREKVENLYDHPEEKSRDLVQLADGRWLDRYSAPIVGEDGSHFGRLWGFRDVTDRERRERELETISTRLQLALESTDTGVFDWDLKTDEVVWDETSERLFGFDPGEFSGYGDWAERLPPDDLARTEEKIEEAIETETTFDAEYRVRIPGGKERWIRGRGAVEYKDGEPSRMIGIHTDVTERRNREERLREAKREAEEASRLKSTMLANMSHEIRTPLTAVNGYTEILTEELSGEPAKMAERAHQGGKRLMKTLNSVLELSRLEAGSYGLDREEIRLQKTVEGTAQLLVSQAEEKGISLAIACKADPVGAWDETALNRIVENLLENAIKFTPEGGQVTVRVGEEGEEALLEVEDTGVGISQAALPDIFEAFEQESEGLSREYEGTGLGLSVVQRLTEALDGSIEVETEKGSGTCFTVRLPKRPGAKRPGATEDER